MEKTLSSGEALQENYRLGKIGVLTAACVCLMDLSVGSPWPVCITDGITALTLNVNKFLPIPTSNHLKPFKSKDIHHLKRME
jgi:hypothetical protein